jgi:hypothetical protein
MAKKQIGQPQREYFCKDCKLHFGEHSHPVKNGKFDTTRFILCRCPYSEHDKLLNHENCKRIEL